MMKKKLTSVLAFIFLFNLCSLPAFASSSESKVDLSIYDSETVEYLQDLNILTDEEIADILEYEQELMAAPNAALRIDFPENPTEGEIFDAASYKISKYTIATAVGVSVGELIKYLMKLTELPAAAVTVAATSIASAWADNEDWDYVYFTVSYIYGKRNDDIMGWTPFIRDMRFE